MTFFRYIRLHEIGTVWASGFILYNMGGSHGNWSALGEFICVGRNGNLGGVTNDITSLS